MMPTKFDVIELEQSHDGFWAWSLRVTQQDEHPYEIVGREWFSSADLCRADGRRALRAFHAGGGKLGKTIDDRGEKHCLNLH